MNNNNNNNNNNFINAQVVRNIISRSLGVKPQHIILGGEIDPNFNINKGSEYSSSCGYSYEYLTVWGWSPNKGLTQFNVDYSSSSGCGRRYEAPELPLHEVATGGELFFIIKTVENAGTWNGCETRDSYKIFKAPNFRSHWENLERADVQRWANWING